MQKRRISLIKRQRNVRITICWGLCHPIVAWSSITFTKNVEIKKKKKNRKMISFNKA